MLAEPDEPRRHRRRQLARRAARTSGGATRSWAARTSQERSDLDDDGWTDLPMYRRVVARPRLFWDDGAGKSLLVALGRHGRGAARRHDARAVAPDGQPFAENLETRRFDGGAVGRIATSSGDRVHAPAAAPRRRITRTRSERSSSATAHRTLFGEVSATRHARPAHLGGRRRAAARALRSRRTCRGSTTRTRVPGVFVQDEFARRDVRSRFPGSARVDRPQRVRDVREPARVGADAAGAAMDDARLRRARLLRADAVHGRDRGDRPHAGRAARRARRGARRQRLGRRDVGARAVRGHRDAVPFAHRRRARRPRDRTTGFSDRDRQRRRARPERAAPSSSRAITSRASTSSSTHMFLWSTEPHPDGTGRRETPLNPRHSATFDLLQRDRPGAHRLRGVLHRPAVARGQPVSRPRVSRTCCSAAWSTGAVGKSRVFVNVENLGDVRQTREHPLVRPDASRRRPLDGGRLGAARRPDGQRGSADTILSGWRSTCYSGSMLSVFCCSS